MNNKQYIINLSRQMADCDANYIRLLKLMPDLESFRAGILESLVSAGSCGRGESSSPGFRPCDFDTDGADDSNVVYTREFILASPVEGADEVRVRISAVEVFRYTSTLEILQLTKVSRWINPPGILVRLYHDASTAEAVAYQGHRSFLAKYATPNSKMYHQDEKRQINEFLGEWLSLCIQAGRSLKAPEFTCTA